MLADELAAIEGMIALREAPSCTRMNLERAGADMLLPWEADQVTVSCCSSQRMRCRDSGALARQAI
jgi:hypothetical protein